MKTALIITYNFPPDGGPAVQRVTKFVKYMQNYGYNAIIITSKHKKEITDSSLINDIPEGIKIFRSVDLGDYCPGELRNKLLKKLFVPDKQKFWGITALNIIDKILEKEKIDIIFSTSPPHSVHLIAKKLKNNTISLGLLTSVTNGQKTQVSNTLKTKLKTKFLKKKL
jgi:hypothetical protein